MEKPDKTVTSLENRYMTKAKRGHTIMVFEDDDIDWSWEEADINQYIRMWNAGIDYRQMIDHFNRQPEELALLHLWLGRKGKIKPRKRGMAK